MQERADRLLDFVQLADQANDVVERLSGGMKRRLSIARSFVNEPSLLLLDEPTTGLDPQARHVVWERLFRLKQQGVTLVLTTHYMDEAEQLCDRLIVMDHGRIAAEGSPRKLIDAWSTREVLELRFDVEDLTAMAEKLQGTPARVEVLPDRCCCTSPTAMRCWRKCTGAGSSRAALSSAGARWRMSSCGSPAARWWIEEPALSSAQPTFASYACWSDAYRRTWRGSAASSLLAPVLYLGALGLGLGSLVDASSGGVAGVPYFEFVGPGLLAATAMQIATVESTYPVMAAIKWHKQYLAMLATPLTVRDVLAGHLLWMATRIGATCAIYLAVILIAGAGVAPTAALALPAALLVGMAFATPITAFAARQQNDAGFAGLFRFVIIPLFLFSGTFFPVSQLPAFLQPIAYVTPLWHGVELCPRPDARHRQRCFRSAARAVPRPVGGRRCGARSCRLSLPTRRLADGRLTWPPSRLGSCRCRCSVAGAPGSSSSATCSSTVVHGSSSCPVSSSPCCTCSRSASASASSFPRCRSMVAPSPTPRSSPRRCSRHRR